jgi:hypothetical protein
VRWLVLLLICGAAEARGISGLEAAYYDISLFGAVGLRPDWSTIGGNRKGAPSFGSLYFANPGNFVGGGFSGRAVLGFRHGLRVQLELADVKLGGIIGGGYPFSTGMVTHFGAAGGFGWQWIAERAAVHCSTVMGVDALSLSVDSLPPSLLARLDPRVYLRNGNLTAWQTRFRFGQQLGARVHVSKVMALFADVEIDYDHAWHVDAGLAFGSNKRME